MVPLVVALEAESPGGITTMSMLNSSSTSAVAVDPKKLPAPRGSKKVLNGRRQRNMQPKMKDGKVVPASPADVAKVARVKAEMAAEKAKEMAAGDDRPVAAGETEEGTTGDISEVETAIRGEEASSALVGDVVSDLIDVVDAGGGRDSAAMDSVVHALEYAKVAKVNKTFVPVPQDDDSLGSISDTYFHSDLDEEDGMLVVEIEYEPEEEEDQNEAKVESELSDDEGCGLLFCGFEHIHTDVEVVEALENDLAKGFTFSSFFKKLGINFDTNERIKEKEDEDLDMDVDDEVGPLVQKQNTPSSRRLKHTSV